MVKRLGRGSIAVALGNFRVRHEQFDQRFQVRILERGHKLRQRSPEFADVFGGLGQVVGEVDIALVHAPQLVNRELKTILVLVDEALDLEKVVLLEDGDEFVDVVPHLGFDLAAAIRQDQGQIRLAIFFGLHLLRRHHEAGGDDLVFLLRTFGDEELFQAAQPIFSSIASQNYYLGSSGSGTAMKLVANTLLGVGMQAIAESVALGQKEGLDRHRLLDVLSHTAVIAPAHLGKLSRADVGDYSAQFAIRLMNKDFGLVLETAAAAKVPMPATEAAFLMNAAEFGEGKEEDFSAVITLMERLARVETSNAVNR